MKLSPFEKWIVFAILATSFFLIMWNMKEPNGFSLLVSLWFFGRVLSAMVIIFGLVLIHFDLERIISFKYKIIETDSPFKKYEAKVLKFNYAFIPTWQSVETESHKYEVQNLFGAKSNNYYSTEVKYDTREEAKKAIECHKKNVLERRNKFFKRPKKNTNKTEYL